MWMLELSVSSVIFGFMLTANASPKILSVSSVTQNLQIGSGSAGNVLVTCL
jgi:hypothetical protein